MAVNSLSPMFLKLHYTGAGHNHTQTLPVKNSGTPTPGVNPDILLLDGTSLDAETCVHDYWELVKALFHTTDKLNSAEAFYQPTPTSPIQFIWAWNPNIAGTSSAPATVAGEAVFTFKTATRGGLKIYLMETVEANDQQFTAADLVSSPEGAISDFILGNTGFIFGRNNDKPLNLIFLTTKENDVLRRNFKL